MPTTPGEVYLIGAGPGDPGLLTLRGRECLERADVVLYDYLAGARLLEMTRPGAELHCLGRCGEGKTWPQSEINRRMVEAAVSGRCVARLKGGDPNIFGRLGEEVDALRAAGLRFEVVPGVTTPVAAGAYAGVTITHRDRASCVAFITGHEQPGKDGQALDYVALAHFPGTLVVYMGANTAARWSGQLLRHGKPADTPALIVRRCSLPDQQTIDCTLGEVAGLLAQGPPAGQPPADQPSGPAPAPLRPPLVVIIGDVAHRPDACDWFTGRPLFGQTVLVTRPRQQAGPMIDRLRELGAEVLWQPVIEILPPADWSAADAAIRRLADSGDAGHTFDWVVFSSRNGVEHFCGRVAELGFDSRVFGRAKLAAIGPATAAGLGAFALRADLHPGEYRAEALANALAEEADGKRFLLVRASRGREVLAEQLRAAGGVVEQVVVYRSVDAVEPATDIARRMAAGEIDWTTATSSAIARSLVSLFG
ncbi:MAG: uroporphyrinogen-III C-methyltransferase, partial [Planctomycetota bacterium]